MPTYLDAYKSLQGNASAMVLNSTFEVQIAHEDADYEEVEEESIPTRSRKEVAATSKVSANTDVFMSAGSTYGR